MSLFRIAFGALLLVDALWHLPLARTFYSDDGLLPRSAVADRISLLDYLPEPWMVTAFFLLWSAAALAVLLGYRTRPALVLLLIILISVHNRNPYIGSGADTLLRVLTFWAIWVPLDDHDSIAARRRSAPRGATFAFPVRLLQMQFVLVYLATGILKLRSPFWQRGDALHDALLLRTFALPPGDWLVTYAPLWLLRGLTWGTLLFELWFVVGVFLPWGQPALRRWTLLAGVALHTAIGLTLAVPDFSLAMLCAYLLFVEPAQAERWSAVLRRLFGRPPAPSPPPEAVEPPSTTARWGRGALVVWLSIVMAHVVWINLRVIAPSRMPEIRGVSRPILLYTGLSQAWVMFTHPPDRYGSITPVGRSADGSEWNVWDGGSAEPEIAPRRFGVGARWRKYEEMIYYRRPPLALRAWAAATCDRPTGPHGAQPEAVTLAFDYRMATADFASPVQREPFYTADCAALHSVDP